MRRSLGDAFDEVCARQPDEVAVAEERHETRFSALAEWSRRISATLESSGLRPGQRVGVMLPNSAAFVAAFYGIVRIGGVAAPLNVGYRVQELQYYLEDLAPVALVTAPDSVPVPLSVGDGLRIRPAVVTVSPATTVRVIRSGRGEPPPAVTTDGTPLLQQYTSGSTGTPKCVVRTHQALLEELRSLQHVFEATEQDRFLGVAPFSHVNGLVRTMLTSMYVGGRLYPVRTFRRREILSLLAREGITVWGGVPHMFGILAETPARGVVDLSSLRVVFSSSAPLLPDDNRRFRSRYGHVVRQLYGSTETGTITFNREARPEEHLASVGTPIPGVELSILDARGNRVAEGAEGEVAVVSRFAASAYLDNPAATRECFRNGSYLTGDLGSRDHAGRLTLSGRKTLMINRGGFKVNPYEVEEAMRAHPKVREVAVRGAPGPHGDEVVVCVVVASQACTTDELLEHCRRRIADYKIPSRIEFRGSLPRSETGKVIRWRL